MLNIPLQRLYQQHLEGQPFTQPEEVVAYLGAVQAQEYALAQWALGLRMESATDKQIEQACAEGRILRTHVMRPTWHFVVPADIRWMLELTAPRVHTLNAYMYRKLELDESTLQRSNELIGQSVVGGQYKTRAELGDILATHGIDTKEGMRLGYLVHYAELMGTVCSGPKQGKQQTYALIAERAPNAKSLPREEALAELTLRFFTSHGPATPHDFAWWSGLTVGDARAGLAMHPTQLRSESVDDQEYWFAAEMPSPQDLPLPNRGLLLPIYDEFGIAYRNHAAVLDPAYAALLDERFFTSAFTYQGQIIGMWRRVLSKKTVIVQYMPFRPFSAEELAAFMAAAQRFGDFLGLSVAIQDPSEHGMG